MYVCMYSSLVGVASEAVGVAFEGTNHKEFFTQVLGRCRSSLCRKPFSYTDSALPPSLALFLTLFQLFLG